MWAQGLRDNGGQPMHASNSSRISVLGRGTSNMESNAKTQKCWRQCDLGMGRVLEPTGHQQPLLHTTKSCAYSVLLCNVRDAACS